MNPHPALLVLDPDAASRATLATALDGHGFEILGVGTPRAALARIQKGDADLLVMDMHLKAADAVTLLGRALDLAPELLVVGVTAHPYPDEIVRFVRRGAWDVLIKPISAERIAEVLTQARASTVLPGPQDPRAWPRVIAQARRALRRGAFGTAHRLVHRALAMRPGSAEAHNLLGAVIEGTRGPEEAEPFYRAAMTFDYQYAPACANLERLSHPPVFGKPDLGDQDGAS